MSSRRTSFEIEASPGTDIWRKPPHTDRFNAPYVMQASIPLKHFISSRVTFWGAWKHQYDQGGLLLCFPSKSSVVHAKSTPSSWIKAGVEYFNGSAKISFVGCDQFADWSLHDLKISSDDPDVITIELKRQGDENGYALWAYQLILDKNGDVAERYPIRECAWVFGKDPNSQMQIGACVARPYNQGIDDRDILNVKFHELVVEVRQ